MFATLLQAVVERTGIRPDEVGDIVVGTVLAPGSRRAMECHMAAFYAGFPGALIFSSTHSPLTGSQHRCSES